MNEWMNEWMVSGAKKWPKKGGLVIIYPHQQHLKIIQ